MKAAAEVLLCGALWAAPAALAMMEARLEVLL
jgi:hypothetical protein